MGYSSEMMATVDIREPIPEKHSKALPPYNGYGSLADSAENCKHLVPRPPKKDFYKLISKGKIVLRFGTRFADCPGHAVSEENRYEAYEAASESSCTFTQLCLLGQSYFC